MVVVLTLLLIPLSPWFIVEIGPMLVAPILVALEDAPQSLLSRCLFHGSCCQHSKMLSGRLYQQFLSMYSQNLGSVLQNAYL